jgi:hypothetical protein
MLLKKDEVLPCQSSVAFAEFADSQVMHFLEGTVQAGPVVNEKGLKAFDAYFEWHRTSGE